MNKYLFLFVASFILFACDNTTELQEGNFDISLLPVPKSISQPANGLKLSNASKIYTSNPEVAPLLEVFQAEIQQITGVLLQTTSMHDQTADIIFLIDTTMADEAYQIEVDRTVEVKGGSQQALALAKTTLLQLVVAEDNALVFPAVSIQDVPDAQYRGLLVDLARKWHALGTVKKLIDLAAFYKVNYLQLHFTDYQSYTLPSRKYPNLSTPDRHYSFAELEELEAYAQARGVIIIPELEVPGHASQFVEKYPEIFAIQDTATNPWIINMGKEKVYEALDELIGEIVNTFKATPYLHIGGDEAIFNKVDEDPDVQAYMKKHDLGDDVHELYRHFLVRMNDIVKKHGKQMCVWEGFSNEGTIEIPKDIIVFEFETNRYLPNLLVDAGYTVVNTSWKPLYVVNQKKWEPKTIYQWNMWRWENWWSKAPSIKPIQVKETPLVIGAQMCSWEQPGDVEIPSLRKRVPALMERIWNTDEKIPYATFMQRLDQLDQKLSLLIDDFRQDSLLLDYNFEE